MKSTDDVIRQIPMFAQLTGDVMNRLSMAARVVTYEAGQTIAREGQKIPPVFFVIEGSVRVFRTSKEGRQQDIDRLSPFQPGYIPPAFTQDTRAPATTIAVTDSKLLCIDQSDFRRLTFETPELATLFLKTLSEKLRNFVELTHDLGLLSVRGRLAGFLLKNLHETNAPARHWTHEQIACNIGTVREVVSRTLKDFAHEGLITLERRHIQLVDPDSLREMSR